MAEKKRSLMKLFAVIAIVQVIIVLISGAFNKRLAIGFEERKFVIRHMEVHYDLQERINQQFQIDEYIHRTAIVQQRFILDQTQFLNLLKEHEHPVLANIWHHFSPSIQKLINEQRDLNDRELGSVVHDLMGITNNQILYEPEYDNYLRDSIQTSLLEYEDLKRSFEEGRLTEREIVRLNRLLLDTVIPDSVLEPQSVTPQIYGSYSLYRIFHAIIGEQNAIGAFRLLRMLLLLDIILLLVAFLTKRLLFDRPSKPQLIFEMLYDLFETFVIDTLGKQNAHFTPYIFTIFIFVWLSNIIGMLPIPGIFEPTRNINVPLGLGFMAVAFVHVTAIRMKGAWPHISQFINPVKNPMFLLDIVGEFAKLVSMSFRLFGNVLGGAIIVLVISSLINYIIMPVGLMMFFSLFIGTVHAFVFTMLALTYISVQVMEE